MVLPSIARRIYHSLAYPLYARPKLNRTDQVDLLGFSFIVPPTVFHPKLYFTSKYMGEYLGSLDLRSRQVLEIGCGSGILSLVSASRGAKVSAIDINPESARATLANARRNTLEGSISVWCGDLFASIRPQAKFDAILLNPPFYKGVPRTVAEEAWYGGDDFEFMKRFIDGALAHLSISGKILMVLSSDAGVEQIIGLFRVKGFTMRCAARKEALFERLYIYEATLS